MNGKPAGGNIRFTYISDPAYAPSYVNGVYGGVTPYREIIANFYLERPESPVVEVRALNPDGSLGPQTEVTDENVAKWARHIRCGVILNLDNAKAIHTWLGEQIRLLERLAPAEPRPFDTPKQ